MRGSSNAVVRFVQSTRRSASSRGTPSMSPITIEGTKIPTSWTRSSRPSGWASSARSKTTLMISRIRSVWSIACFGVNAL